MARPFDAQEKQGPPDGRLDGSRSSSSALRLTLGEANLATSKVSARARAVLRQLGGPQRRHDDPLAFARVSSRRRVETTLAAKDSESIERLQAMAPRVEAADYAPLYVAWQMASGFASTDGARPADGVKHFQRALRSALRHRLWGLAHRAATSLVLAAGGREGLSADGLAYAVTARALQSHADPTNVPYLDFTLATLEHQRGQFAEALEYFRVAQREYERVLDPDDPTFVTLATHLGSILIDLKQPAEAEVELRRAMEFGGKVFGSTHPKVAAVRFLRGVALSRLWRLDEADEQLRVALTDFEETVGLEHRWTLMTRTHLADLLRIQNRFEEAEKQIRNTIVVRERLYGRGHLEVARSMSVYALVLLGQGRYSEAVQYHRELLALYERYFGRDNLDVAMTRVGLGKALAGVGRFAEAEYATREGLSTLLRLDAPPTDEAEARHELANVLRASGRLPEAKSEMQTAIGLLEGHGDGSIDLYRINLAELELELGDSAAAVQLLEPIWQKDTNVPTQWRIETARLLARGLEKKDPQRAESLQRAGEKLAQE